MTDTERGPNLRMDATDADFVAAAGEFHATRLHVANLVQTCTRANERWWQDPHTGQRVERNVGELLMLMVSELAEAMEGHRKDLMDTHLKHRKMIEVELADCLIRICDTAGQMKLDLGGAVAEKLEYNAKRADHTFEARRAPGGKRY